MTANPRSADIGRADRRAGPSTRSTSGEGAGLLVHLEPAAAGALARAAAAGKRTPSEEAARLIEQALDEQGHMAAMAQLLGGPTTYGLAMILGRVMHETGTAAHQAVAMSPMAPAPVHSDRGFGRPIADGGAAATGSMRPEDTHARETGRSDRSRKDAGAAPEWDEGWTRDPVAFDQVVKAVCTVLDALRPPGEVTAPLVGDGREVIDLNTLFVDLRESFAVTTLFAVAEPGSTPDDGLRAWGRRVADMLARGTDRRSDDPGEPVPYRRHEPNVQS